MMPGGDRQNEAVIGIGSNINAEENISGMFGILNQKVEVVMISLFVKTKPIGIENQPYFTNGAVRIKTQLEMEELKLLLKQIESMLGRDHSKPKFSSRTIDLDIVVWNGSITDEDYYQRDFLRKSVNQVMTF
jgi:2-amino-4-hydroxy-6-hydroxymethyldihydropteridine diphosphokinase